eukprot:4922044-Prymnesium_polylepis.1
MGEHGDESRGRRAGRRRAGAGEQGQESRGRRAGAGEQVTARPVRLGNEGRASTPRAVGARRPRAAYEHTGRVWREHTSRA